MRNKALIIAVLLACTVGFAQTYSLSPVAKQIFFGTNGNFIDKPLAGGKLYTYASGTTSPLASYSDANGTPNTNPVTLDAAGFATIFLPDGVNYRFVLTDANGVQQWSQDNVIAGSGGGSSSVNACSATGGDLGARINNAIATCAANGCQVDICAGNFTVTTPVVIPTGVHIVGAGDGATTLNWNTGSYLFNETDVSNTSIESLTVVLGSSAMGVVKGSATGLGGQFHTFKDLYISGGGSSSIIFNLTSPPQKEFDVNFFTRIKAQGFSGVLFHVDHAVDSFWTDIEAIGATSNLTGRSLEIDSNAGGIYVENFSSGQSGKNAFVLQNLTDTQNITGNVSSGSAVSIPVSNSALCYAGAPASIIWDGTNVDGLVITGTPDPTHIVVASLSHNYTTSAKVYCGLAPSWIHTSNLIADCSTGGDGWLMDQSLYTSVIGFWAVRSWSAGAGKNCVSQADVTPAAAGIRISGGYNYHISANIRANEGCGVLIDSANAQDITIENSSILNNNQSNVANMSGVCATSYMTGLKVIGNTISDLYDEVGSGFQQYGVYFAGGGQENIIANNRLSGNVLGAVNVQPTNSVMQYGNINGVTITAAPDNLFFGNLSVGTANNAPSSWLVPNFGQNTYGFGINLKYNGGTSLWNLGTDLTNNGGFGFVGGQAGNGYLVAVPTNTPAAGQAISNAALIADAVFTVTPGTFDFNVKPTIGGSGKNVPIVATPTVGQAACIYAAGPPVQIGKCTSVVGAGGACTCAP